MWIQVLGLSCLLSLLEAQAPTYNPECSEMKTAAKHLKTGIKSYLQKSSECNPNPHCTGVKCTWSGGGVLEIDLHHCDNPVNYHVLINAPSKNIHKNLTLKEGDGPVLAQGDLGSVKLKVKELTRQGNIVTTTVQLMLCPKLSPSCLSPFAVLNQQKFCVRMEKCPGYNASTVHYKPCGYKPTGHSTVHSTHHTFRSTSSGHSTTQPSSLKISSTGRHPVTEPYSKIGTSTANFPATGKIGHHKGDDSPKLSTAAIIGICAAGVFAFLVVIAVIVYWKKYHHRSRLRAAYYNDISMHDPLYEDFGPEVA